MLIKLNILAYTSSEATSRDLAAALSGVEGMELRVRKLDPAALGAEFEPGVPADVVLLESDGKNTDAMPAVETFVAALPADIAAFVLGDASDPDALRRLMRAGVRDVLARPLVRQEVLTALTAMLSAKRTRAVARGENVTSTCTFIDAKGGGGSTMLAVNTACSLAVRHKARVALIDFDMQFGKCALQLDLQPQTNVSDALRQADRIDSVLLKALMVAHASGVTLLAAPANLTTPVDSDAHAVRRLIDTAAADYDVVIVNLPRVIAPWSLEAMRASTTVFLVIQNSLATIRDARLIVDHLPRAGIDARRVELINNRAMAKGPSVSIEQLKTTLKHEKVHRVRNDFEAAQACSDQGVPLYKSAPRSDLAKDIDHLADYIWEAHGHGKVRKDSLLERFFHRENDSKPAAGK